MKTETWVRLAAIGICAVTAGAICYTVIRYFAGIVLPFFLAALIASMLRPAASALRARTKLSEKLCGTVLILGAVGLIGTAGFFLVNSVYESARSLVAEMLREMEAESGPLHGLAMLSDRVREIFPEEEERLGTLYNVAAEMLREALTAAAGTLSGAAGSVIVRLPRVFFSVLVGVIALFYIFFDAEALRCQLRFFLSERVLARISTVLARIREGVGGCVRAYLLLMLLTFSELLAGFLILNIDGAVTAALLTSLVDLLPVLGVGCVLIPWSILALLAGDMFRGVGLLVIFAVMVIVRQFAEPRIVGTSLGIHPLLTLLAVFAGYRLMGIAGMLLVPIGLYAIKAAVGDVGRDISEKASPRSPDQKI